jgi:L-threonylcarbamoyladenylate synthase
MRQKTTKIIRAEDNASVDTAERVLQEGGLVAFPTDTVYGVGGKFDDERALEEIFTVKDRDRVKPLPVLISSLGQLSGLTPSLTESLRKLVERFWPGPLTLVLPAKSGLSTYLTKDGTLGVRMPAHPFALQLLEASGPLGVTSANISGEPSPQTAEIVYQTMRGRIDLIVDGGTAPGGIPSTVVHLSESGLELLRAGPIGLDQIHSTLAAPSGL